MRAIEFVIKKDLYNGTVYNVVTKNATVRQVVDAIKVYIPQVQLQFVDSPIMNQLSYEVLNSRFLFEGFTVQGDFEAGIYNTVSLLSAANKV